MSSGHDIATVLMNTLQLQLSCIRLGKSGMREGPVRSLSKELYTTVVVCVLGGHCHFL